LIWLRCSELFSPNLRTIITIIITIIFTADGQISRLSLHSSQDSAVSSPGSSMGSVSSSQCLDSQRDIELALG
jgi:hypothetical protein